MICPVWSAQVASPDVSGRAVSTFRQGRRSTSRPTPNDTAFSTAGHRGAESCTIRRSRFACSVRRTIRSGPKTSPPTCGLNSSLSRPGTRASSAASTAFIWDCSSVGATELTPRLNARHSRCRSPTAARISCAGQLVASASIISRRRPASSPTSARSRPSCGTTEWSRC